MIKKSLLTKQAIHDYFDNDVWESISDLEAVLGMKLLRCQTLSEIAIFVEPEMVQIYELDDSIIDNLWYTAKISNFDYIWRSIDNRNDIKFKKTLYYEQLKSFLNESKDDIINWQAAEKIDRKLKEVLRRAKRLDPDLFPGLALFAASMIVLNLGGEIALDAGDGFRGPIVVLDNGKSVDCYTDILRHLFEGADTEWSLEEYLKTLIKEAWRMG